VSRGAYTLRLGRPLDGEVVRLVRSQTNRARRELKAPSDEAVHAARKALKRARAALRLVRGALPRERFRSIDHELRGLGRLLAPARDAVVALELVDVLRAEEALGESALGDLRDHLSTARADAWRTLDAEAVAAIRARLGALRLAPEELDGLDAGALHDGLARTYRRGRKRLARATASPRADALHAWRRQVKHLGYQLRLIAPAWPLVLRPTARALDALGSALGDEHDLAELYRVAARARLDRASLRELARWTKRRRASIHEIAWPLGARVYAESPGAFAGRITAYLAAAASEARGAPPHAIPPPPPPEAPLVQVAG
jgi:CHAD domain-containing protein